MSAKKPRTEKGTDQNPGNKRTHIAEIWGPAGVEWLQKVTESARPIRLGGKGREVQTDDVHYQCPKLTG